MPIKEITQYVYTLDMLSEINARFLSKHKLSQCDVEMVNNHVRCMSTIRKDKVVGIGDTLRYTNSHGDFFCNAIINNIDEDKVYICESPYIPAISIDEKRLTISLSTSGGAWKHIPVGKLVWTGTEDRLFSDWGNCGACANGLIQFFATVNVWEYVEDSLFEGYTTEYYNKMYISYHADKLGKPKNGSSNLYFGKDIAFRNSNEYSFWLETYKGKRFKNYSENTDVVFHYKEFDHLISEDEWNELALPVDTRCMNSGVVIVKVEYDDNQRKIDTYRYTNTGVQNALIPYMLARNDSIPFEASIDKDIITYLGLAQP